MTYRRGLVLGKFLPPHQGHEYLIRHAAERVEELVIVVDPVFEERIPVETRMAWMRRICPEATVLTLNRQLPQYPHEAPTDFWQQWEAGLKAILPGPVDAVFASEEYGIPLASVLDARFEMVDLERKAVPISATTIRTDPYSHWDRIADPAKPYFCRKVCIFGPESVGKSTLTENLARHFKVDFVPEYARTVIEENQGHLDFADMEKIALSHEAAIREALENPKPLLLVDTDAIATKIWSQELFGQVPPMLEPLITRMTYDLYLVLDVDVPWVEDIVRFRPEERETFLAQCIRELEHYGRPYVLISGSWEERFQKAVHAINPLLHSGFFES